MAKENLKTFVYRPFKAKENMKTFHLEKPLWQKRKQATNNNLLGVSYTFSPQFAVLVT